MADPTREELEAMLERMAGPDDGSWWCEKCSKWVPPLAVTYDERHDERNGGCGRSVFSIRDGDALQMCRYALRLQSEHEALVWRINRMFDRASETAATPEEASAWSDWKDALLAPKPEGGER